jgi:hypothetical protein
MPFGQRRIPVPDNSTGEAAEDRPKPQPCVVDFDNVWDRLIKPALEMAGCDAFRADSEVSAGDIRTDMFFELVTADFVVADISIPNPNVYYELGIRDGVGSRGVFIIDGGWSASRPFDIAQDRSFRYPGYLFELGRETGNKGSSSKAESKEADLSPADPHFDLNTGPHPVGGQTDAVRGMAVVFRQVFAADTQGMGSPLYSHLPGLKPANWEQIDTSRSRYFGSLQSGWEDRVRRAQELNRPGHILTIAQDAPTRVHRNKIMVMAGRALIGLNQFAPAEEVLEEVLQITPDDIDAQLLLAMAKISQGDALGAEHQLRNMLRFRQGDPNTSIMLGYAYRLLWYVQWKGDPKPRERAKESSRLLVEAIHCLAGVQRLHPELYLSGYNALLLISVGEKLFGPDLKLPEELTNRTVLMPVVRYMANAAKQVADETGDYDAQFWSSVAISGLDMLDGNGKAAIQGVRDACAVSSATLFNLQWLLERLTFLKELDYELDTVCHALAVVQNALDLKRGNGPKGKWNRVLLFHGYPLDKSDAKKDDTRPRFPRVIKKSVESEIDAALDYWKVGAGDMAMCTASTECGIYFGQRCLDRGAYVRVLVLEPTRTQLVEEMRDPDFGDWTAARSKLLTSANEVWYDREELGIAVDGTSLRGRHSRWLLNTARIEADNATATGSRLLGIVLSNRTFNIDDPDDSAFFIAGIRSFVRYQSEVKPIDLTALAEQAGTMPPPEMPIADRTSA